MLKLKNSMKIRENLGKALKNIQNQENYMLSRSKLIFYVIQIHHSVSVLVSSVYWAPGDTQNITGTVLDNMSDLLKLGNHQLMFLST